MDGFFDIELPIAVGVFVFVVDGCGFPVRPDGGRGSSKVNEAGAILLLLRVVYLSVRWPFIGFGRWNFFDAEPDFLIPALMDHSSRFYLMDSAS